MTRSSTQDDFSARGRDKEVSQFSANLGTGFVEIGRRHVNFYLDRQQEENTGRLGTDRRHSASDQSSGYGSRIFAAQKVPHHEADQRGAVKILQERGSQGNPPRLVQRR